MTTHNTKEEGIVERAVIKLAATGLFEGKGDEVLQPFADWLLEVLTTAAQEKEEAVKAERERVNDVIENKRIPLFVALDENDAARITNFNKDLDIILKAIKPQQEAEKMTKEELEAGCYRKNK